MEVIAALVALGGVGFVAAGVWTIARLDHKKRVEELHARIAALGLAHKGNGRFSGTIDGARCEVDVETGIIRVAHPRLGRGFRLRNAYMLAAPRFLFGDELFDRWLGVDGDPDKACASLDGNARAALGDLGRRYELRYDDNDVLTVQGVAQPLVPEAATLTLAAARAMVAASQARSATLRDNVSLCSELATIARCIFLLGDDEAARASCRDRVELAGAPEDELRSRVLAFHPDAAIRYAAYADLGARGSVAAIKFLTAHSDGSIACTNAIDALRARFPHATDGALSVVASDPSGGLSLDRK